ncbi:MAG: hypothetical protein CVV13_04475 [Gammaproteobacteria bacterium HGW-Gammaproteobacteria-3]|nr:MAG: hypothetical protein CVV13_04475 [Gammaproteobacteria bacterium HGW-Gammaproteobacteria-3]
MSLALIAFGLLITMPGMMGHAFIWIVIHIYEMLEFILDEAIHHFFETSRHATQVIVFYLMAGLFLCGFYLLVRRLLVLYRHAVNVYPQWRNVQKEKITEFWASLSWVNKIQVFFGSTFSGAFLVLWVF